MKEPGVFFSLALLFSLFFGVGNLNAQEVRKQEWVRTTALLSSHFLGTTYRVIITYKIPERAAHNSRFQNPITHYRFSPYPINKIVIIEYRKDNPMIFRCVKKNCLE